MPKPLAFISYSGSKGRDIARSLHEWLSQIFHTVEYYFAHETLPPGKQIPVEIDKALGIADTGIFCFPDDGSDSSWMGYELGRLMDRGAPVFLFSLGGLPGPFRDFAYKTTNYSKQDVGEMLRALNERWREFDSDAALERSLDIHWPHLQEKLGPPAEDGNATEQATCYATLSSGCDTIEIFGNRNAPAFKRKYPMEGWISRYLHADHAKITVVARTAEKWVEILRNSSVELEQLAANKTIECVIADPLADTHLLAAEERGQFRDDLGRFLRTLRKQRIPGLHYFLSPFLVLDSMTMIELSERNLQGQGGPCKLVFLDLYTGTRSAEQRPTIVVTHLGDWNQTDCLAKLMSQRVIRARNAAGVELEARDIEDTLQPLDRSDFEPSRENPTRCLAPRLIEIFNYYDRVSPFLGADEGEPLPANPPPPACAQIEITNRCNVTECLGCTRPGVEEMNPRMFASVVASLKSLGTKNIVLSGGEPLAHPHIGKILEIAREEKMNVALLSDGLMLDGNADLAREVVKAVSSLRISVDGCTAKTYRAVRKLRGSHPAHDDPLGAVERAIAGIRRARDVDGSRLVHLGVCTTLFEENQHETEAIWRWVQAQAGVDSLVFKFAHGTPNTIGSSGQSFVCRPATIRRIRGAMEGIKAAATGLPTVNAEYMINFIDKMGEESIASGEPTKTLYDRSRMICFTPLTFLLIDPSGRAYRCCHSYLDNNGKFTNARDGAFLGQLGEKSIEDIWGRGAFRRIRATNRLEDGDIVCRCPTHGECTRHWKHNEELTKLFRAYERASLTSRTAMIEKLQKKLAGPKALPDQFWL